MNIKVAIRVRPFNKREKKLKSQLCIEMQNNSTRVIDQNGKELKNFSFDNCFWSHDGFKSDKEGYLHPKKNSDYDDQKKVYDALGKDLLKNSLKGYNCCLFAYGQTGSGKSYSIFGYGCNKGIVPLICDELLNGKTLKKTKTERCKLSISMLEIYNEKVQDLLVAVEDRPSGGLKIRENSKLGVFVQGLNKYVVKSYPEIEKIIEKGNENKTLGSTLMNATSSRAHTIITLELIQKKQTKAKTTQKTSNIFLVDLAGSEKVGKTGAKADRLKEACSINKSLTVLGIVIHQLYKKSTGKKTIVSYRDSALTRMLQNALGGNSKTTMICAISPALDNIDETISTLRYADQAKKIKLKAVINESETDRMIRELTEENVKLKKMLEDYNKNKKNGKKMTKDQINNLEQQIKKVQGAIDEEEEDEKEDKSDEMSEDNTKKEKGRRQSIQNMLQGLVFQDDKKFNDAHILNLNEDPLLSEKIKYNLTQHPVYEIGRSIKNEKTKKYKIVLNGVGILYDHAKLILDVEKGILIIAATEEDAALSVFINGESLVKNEKEEYGEISFERELKDMDRLIIGTGSTFLVRMPIDGVVKEKYEIDEKEVDWEFCQLEKFEHQEHKQRDIQKKAIEEKQKELMENEKKLKENFELEKKQYEAMIKQKQEEFQRSLLILEKEMGERENQKKEQAHEDKENEKEDILKQIEIEHKTKELEFFVRMNKLKKEGEILKNTQFINQKIENNLIKFYPKIKEANTISEVLNRRITFIPFVASLNLLTSLNDKNKQNDLIVKIKVINKEDGWINYWSIDKFEERLEIMREQIEDFFNYNTIEDEEDPFWDPQELFLYARGFCILKNNLYRFGIEHKVGLLGYEGDIGYLMINLIPVDEQGNEIKDDEELEDLVQEPCDLITHGLSCHMKVVFEKLIVYNISELMGKKCNFSYEILTMNGLEYFHTPNYVIKDNQVNLDYSQFINLEKVDNEIIDYYMNKKLQIKFHVEDFNDVKAHGKLAPPKIIVEKQLFKNDYEQKVVKKIENIKSDRKRTILEPRIMQRPSKNLCNIM